MTEYINREAVDLLFDARIIRASGFKLPATPTDSVEFNTVEIRMTNEMSLYQLEFHIKCHVTGGRGRVICASTHHSETAAQDEALVKWNAMDYLNHELGKLNDYRKERGYSAVQFKAGQKLAPFTLKTMSSNDIEVIDYAGLVDENRGNKNSGLLARFHDRLKGAFNAATDDAGDTVRESDFVANPDGTRPWMYE